MYIVKRVGRWYYNNTNERVRTEAIKFVIIDDFFTLLTVLLPKSFGAVIRETFTRGEGGVVVVRTTVITSPTELIGSNVLLRTH